MIGELRKIIVGHNPILTVKNQNDCRDGKYGGTCEFCTQYILLTYRR